MDCLKAKKDNAAMRCVRQDHGSAFGLSPEQAGGGTAWFMYHVCRRCARGGCVLQITAAMLLLRMIVTDRQEQTVPLGVMQQARDF